MIGRSGERGSGISVLAARHDDDIDTNYGWFAWNEPYVLRKETGGIEDYDEELSIPTVAWL